MAVEPTNPLIPGFSPDPSLVNVNGWYYLVNSSFHMFPGLPIYASQDLISWKHIGNAINRPSQLSLAKSETSIVDHSDLFDNAVASGGLFAPTIRYHDGVFYIVCTNAVHGAPSTNFIVSTQDVWGNQWSDPVYFDFDGIDPSIFFDHGKAYLQGSASPGPFNNINLFEIDLQTGKKLSEERTIWTGTGGIFPEGPHIYKRNGWYYLMISEGGTWEGHMITMARSRDIWGPYEACPNNPILTARGTKDYVQHVGHCEAFQDDAGQWWGVCLGVRKDEEGRYIMGRETFITRGKWDEDWISFEMVKIDKNLDIPEVTSPTLSSAPGMDYLYIRDANLANYDVGDEYLITLTSSPVDLSHPEMSPTFISKRQRKLNGRSTVTIGSLVEAESGAKLKFGIACYKDEHRYLRIFYDTSESVIVFEVINKAKRIAKTERRNLAFAREGLSLSIKYTEREYSLLYKARHASAGDWICLAVVDTLDLTNRDFVGPVIGIFATAESSGPKVTFEDFNVD
ncbi:hypothetical protein LCI18_006573 [Fusarium solani-melongenae]|uniref:Uncharacterized protein n=1 Tax=Fusarium solani subsp. cucurbitae TaxID=2747967 RepID=A0ACD3Z3J2_FUSSC|nr:hypothetical protein LCI18_006573 [Fusarium solani-melongenae]